MPNRLAYRQAASRLLGGFQAGTVTAGTTTALVECTAWPFKSTLAQDERFEHWFVYLPSAASADRTRVVTTGGYDPNTGKMTVDQLYSVAPTTGWTVEVSSLVDPETVNRLVNDALKLCRTAWETTFTVSSTRTVRHSLATSTWLTDADDVFQVGYLATGESRSEIDPFSRAKRGRATERNGVVYLEGPSFNTTDTAYVLAGRPAYTLCRAAGGTYGDLTGLDVDTDEAPVETDWVAAGVKMLAWDELRELFWPGEARVAEQKVAQAAARFWALARDYWTEPARTFTPLTRWGVPNYSRTPY